MEHIRQPTDAHSKAGGARNIIGFLLLSGRIFHRHIGYYIFTLIFNDTDILYP